MKNFKEFAIPTVALFLICLVATTLLAVTNKVTAPKIAELSAQTEVETRQKVLPAATQFGETQEMKGGSGTYAVGKDASGNEVGYVFVTVSKGYGGDVKIMTGVDKNGAVTGISPLELNETAGLGSDGQRNNAQCYYRADSRPCGVRLALRSARPAHLPRNDRHMHALRVSVAQNHEAQQHAR